MSLPENFEPVIPEWPTPTGKTEDDAKKHCEDKIKDTETYKACKRVLGGRFRINGALQQCVDDTLVCWVMSHFNNILKAQSNKRYFVHMHTENFLLRPKNIRKRIEKI